MTTLHISIAVVALIAAACYRSHHHHNIRVRHQILLDSQPTIYSFTTTHCLTTLRRSDNSERTLDELVSGIRSTVGEKLIYLGKVIRTVIPSKQLPGDQKKLDIVLVTAWKDVGDLTGFLNDINALDDWEYATSQAFKRNPILNAAFTQGMGMLSLSRFTSRIDLSAQSSDEWQSKINLGLDAIENDGNLNDPVIMWNWIQHGNKKEQASDKAYVSKMMAMLSQNGGGPMHIGKTIDLREVDQDGIGGRFDQIAGVYYPSRGFFSDLIRSEWMEETAKGKTLGDTLAVLTTPYQLKEVG